MNRLSIMEPDYSSPDRGPMRQPNFTPGTARPGLVYPPDTDPPGVGS